MIARPFAFLFRPSLAVACLALCQCTTLQPQKEVENYILGSERQWAESVATGDTAALERILADDFVGVDPKGKHYTKAEMIADTRNARKYFVSNHLDQVKVRFYRDTAVAFVWTDIWIRRNGKWQIVAAEDLIAPVKPAEH